MKILERLKRLAAPSMHLAITLLTALGVGSVFAATPTPVALWDEDFSTLTRTTSNVTYTLDLNGNGLSADNSTITIGNGAGVLVDFGSELASGLTVLFKYSNLDLSLGTEQTMATRRKGSNADLNRTGVFLKSTGQSSGVWQGGEYNANQYTSASTRGTVTSSQASGVMAFTYNNTGATISGTRLYQLDLAAKKRTELYVWAGLGSSSESASQGVAIGGNRGTATSGGPATGMKITGVAVFSGNLNESEMIEYVLKVFPTYRIEENTTVSALNSQIAASSASEIVLSVANGVEIDVDAAFSATVPVTIASEGSITLSAASQPDASYFSVVDFSGVKGAVKRSWLTPGVVGYNFKSDSGANTAAALVSGGTWQSSVTSASGSTTAMYDDGLSTFSWTSGGTYSIKSGTFLNGYLDDGAPARITLSNIPYDAYDVVVYAATDTEGYGFSPVTVNGTSYTWDSGSGETVAGTSKWGASREAVAIYGTNALRIKSLSGPLTIQAGSNDSTNKSRGGIAAVQVMPTTASDIVLEDYTLTLDGTAATWTGGTWSRGDAADTAPSVADEVVIVATASTTLTMDADAVISRLVVRGTDDSQVTIVNGSGSLIVGSITVESGILKPNSTTTCQPIVVNDGGALDLGNASAGHKVNISGRGVLKDNQYTGAVFSSVAIGNTNAQLEGITLSGDATIRCDQNWGIIRSSYYSGTLDIGEYTLTKQGSASFWLCNTDVSGTGTIRLEGGNLTTINTASSMNYSTLELSDGATLNVNGANLTVKTLTCQGGSYIQVASGKSLNFTTISLDGTVSYKGPISASSQSINIPSDVTFKWVDTSWTSGDYFTGTGTLELMADSAGLDHTVAGATFGGTVKLSNDSDGKQNNLTASETGAMFSNRPELIVNASSVHLGPYWNNNLEHPIQVRNLSGSGQLRAQWTSGKHNYLIETLQERNTAFTGTLGCDESSGNRYINFSVIGDNSGDIHSLTITQSLNGSDNGGCKASTLTVADNAKVVFTSGGKWGYGQIVVNSDGWLESANTASIARMLTLNSGSHVALVPNTPITAGTVTIPDNSTVYFDVSEFGIAAGDTANIVKASTSLSVGNNVTLAATSGHYTISVNGNNIQATSDVCTWADGVWSDDASDYENVSVAVAAAGSTLTLDKDYSFDSMTLSGSSGALTIDGNGHTLTVGDIVIPNGVTLIASSALTVTGTISGGGNLTVPSGVTFTNAAGTTWTIGKRSNETSNRSGVLTVQNGGELIINGQLDLENNYQGGIIEIVIVENGGALNVSSSGKLQFIIGNVYGRFAINGALNVHGSLDSDGDVIIASTGVLTISETTTKCLNAYDVENSGTIVFDGKIQNLTYAGSAIKLLGQGKMLFLPTDSFVGINLSEWMLSAVDFGAASPTMYFDVTKLTALPTGTAATTLITTSTALALTADSLTGCSSDYYVKQDGTTGAVTLQLYAAKDSEGTYYEDAEDAFDAVVADHSLTVTILDGAEASYASTLATKGLFVSGSEVKFLAAEVINANTSAIVAQYSSVQDAIDLAAENANLWYYAKVYANATVESSATSLLIMKASNDVELTIVCSTPGYSIVPTTDYSGILEGLWGYSKRASDASFTWNPDNASGAWGDSANWKIGDESATRSPGGAATARDAVEFPVSVSVSVGSPVQYLSGMTISASAGEGVVLTGADSVDDTQIVVGDGGIVLASASSKLTTTRIALNVMPTTSVEGKRVSVATNGRTSVYTVADSTAVVYDAENNEVGGYATVAAAVADAANGQKVKLFADSSETITFSGKSITFDEGDYTFTGSFSGSGTLVLSAALKSAAPARWFESWTGTVWLQNLSDITIVPANYGNAGSVIKFTGVTGQIAAGTAFLPAVELEDNGATKALTLNSYSTISASTISFSEFRGSGTFATVGGTADAYPRTSFKILKWDDFAGTLEIDRGRAIFGTDTISNDDWRYIYVSEDAAVTIADGKTWTADQGLRVNGELTVESNSALSRKAVQGSGTIIYEVAPNDSTTAPSFHASLWTGVVELPVGPANGIKLQEYGTVNSKIKINGFTSGHLMWEDQNILAEVVLAGPFIITATSNRNYDYARISGTGSFSVSNSNASNADPKRITITRLDVAADSVGMSVANNTSAVLSIGTLALPAGALVTPDTKLLSTGGTGTITLGAVSVGGVVVTDLVYERKNKGAEGDGIYVTATVSTETVGEETVKVLDTGANTSVDATGISGKVAIPGTVTQITGVTSANLLLKVTYNDGTAQTKYYGILAVDGSGNVSLNGNATVTVNDTVVKVEPELRETGPITVAAATSVPTLTVKTIPGLWYGLKSCATANGSYTAEDSEQAKGATVSLTAGAVTTVKYYKVVVGTTAADVQ